VRAFVLILVLVAALPAAADVIHLKNGRTIWADQVREVKDHVEYELGEDTYAIPKSSVDHIDAGGLAPVHGGTGASVGAPDINPPAPSFNHEEDVALKVIHDGKVDVEALANFGQSSNPESPRLRIFWPASTSPIMATLPRPNATTNRRCASNPITRLC